MGRTQVIANARETGQPNRLSITLRQTSGNAMTTMSKVPTTIDMTVLGILRRPRPKVTNPIMQAASTTPGMEPAPPWMLTPPNTTIVITSSS
jgi:hypothetical protein